MRLYVDLMMRQEVTQALLEYGHDAIRLKVHPPSPAAVTHVLLPFLMRHSQHEFLNMLVILSPKRVRWIRTGQ